MTRRRGKSGSASTEESIVLTTTTFGSVQTFAMDIFHGTFFYCRYRVHEIRDPYLVYTIKVTLQQLNFEQKVLARNGTKLPPKQVWRTIGTSYVGPDQEASHIAEVNKGNSSSPQVRSTLAL